MHLGSLIIGLILAYAPSILARKKDDAVLLSKVKALTLRDGALTTHRRVGAVPQLNCVGGNAKGLYDVDVMRCQNSGAEYDTEDIQWTCKADLPPEFKLGSTDVICEGYDSSDDPYVLKGSCGVEYRLILTPQGEQKYRDHINNNAWKKKESSHSTNGSSSDSLAAGLFWIIFAVIVVVILYSIFFPSGNNGEGFGRGFGRGLNLGGGGGGGGGHDDGNDPPPPYTPRAPPRPKKSTSTGYGSNSRRDGPGFWTGAATGAAAGYAAGAYTNRHQRTQPGTSNWFGGTNTSPVAGPSYTRGGSSSSPPAPSSSRQESTGFGGTSRR